MKRVKIFLVILCICVLYVIIVSRLFYFSVIKYEDKFDRISLKENNRKNIVDKNGVVIASNIKVKNLYLNSDLIEDKDFIAKELSKILKLDYDFIYEKIDRPKNKFVLIKKNIFPQDEYKIRHLPIASIVFEEDYLRFYPHSNLFSHVVGYVNGDKDGALGIEEYYDSYLKYYASDNLKLTLDVRIQEAMRDELLKAKEQYKANFMVGIIMETETGNILGMVSLPDFDPNDVKKDSNTFNFATYGNYELGSVFKVFTFANGIENAGLKKDTMFDVSNKIKYGNFVINDTRNITKKKKINLSEAFALSSNLVAVQIAEELGIKKQVKFFESIGLLEKLNLDIKQTVLPLQPRRWSEINLMTIAYGYGIAVSPLHVLSATNAILNNGFLVTPRFSYNFDKQIKKKIASDETSNIMRDLFYNTVEKGTAKLVKIDGLRIGGKTGTARKNTKNGYKEGEHIVSFVGGFPIDKPKYSIIVIADRPKIDEDYDGTGGTVAASVAKEIILNALPFFDIKPVFNIK